jgi:hypothetical protein
MDEQDSNLHSHGSTAGNDWLRAALADTAAGESLDDVGYEAAMPMLQGGLCAPGGRWRSDL